MAKLLTSAAVFVLLSTSLFTGVVQAGSPAEEPFVETWNRTDKPVQDGLVARTWMWGPQDDWSTLHEPYEEAPDGQRQVLYFDKARMEITDPDDDPDSAWYVTNGLLVVELITGDIQIGDDSFEERGRPPGPAQVNVAGDADDPEGPTYATFGNVLDAESRAIGSTLNERMDRDANVTVDDALEAYGVTAGQLDPVTNHAIATPFWEFMNSSGLVYEDGQFVTEALFENAYFATGRPITEAYWAEVKVGGQQRDVLMQCFERRCLTYTPGNPDGFVVEAGNVGRHYYAWRYGTEAATEYAFAGKFGAPSFGTELNAPHKTASTPEGEVYVSNTGNHEILKFGPDGVLITRWGGYGAGNGQFDNPVGIDVDSLGNVYVADYGNDRIQKFDKNGAFITTWGSEGTGGGQFDGPWDLSVSIFDRIFVTELNNHRIQSFHPDGTPWYVLGELGTGAGQFNAPQGIHASPGSLVYVADTGNNRIQIFEGGGSFFDMFGTPGPEPGQLDAPSDVYHAGGTIYVAELGTDRIQVFDVETDEAVGQLDGAFNDPLGIDIQDTEPGTLAPMIVTDTGAGAIHVYEYTSPAFQNPEIELPAHADTWATAMRGQFSAGAPNSIEMSPNGLVYVLDRAAANIRAINPAGGEVLYIRSEITEEVILTDPAAIATDADGNIYVVDAANHDVLKLDGNGELLARFNASGEDYVYYNEPESLAVDDLHNIYIGFKDGAVRKFDDAFNRVASWDNIAPEGVEAAGVTAMDVHGGVVYVIDDETYLQYRVRVFSTGGDYIFEWPVAHVPIGLAASPGGSIFVSTEAGTIEKYAPDGTFVTTFGSYGDGDGEISRSSGGYYYTIDLTVAASGRVYVADTGNQRVQMFDPVS